MHRQVLALLCCVVIAGCTPRVSPTPPEPFPPDPGPVEPIGGPYMDPPEEVAAERVSVDHRLQDLSLRDRVAQLVMPWIPGTYASFDDPGFRRAVAWVDSLHVGGIIVSIGSPLDIAAKLNRLQRVSRLPLLVASDLEGGTAIRFNGGTGFPTNMGVAAAGSELDAYQMGRVSAMEGRAVGIHMAFAPVADVNNNPANPIINTRSFGESPEQVGRLVAAAIRGMQDHGMLATAKHFPGHGDTGTDSHLSLPVIVADWSRLDSVELVPFRAAVRAGVRAVMSAHIALPGVDSGTTRPATVSPPVLTGILRDSLDFEGLVVTDALDMGALVNGYGAGEAAVLSFLAGADLLLQPADPAVAIDAMVRAVESGRISEERLNRSVRRVLDLKDELGLFEHRTVDLELVPTVVGSAAFAREAEDVTARSLVLVRDSTGVVDSLRRRPRRVAIISFGTETGTTLGAELRSLGFTVNPFRLHPSSGPASYDSARAVIRSETYTIFTTAVRATAWSGNIAMPPAFAALVDSTARSRPTLLVSFGSPYLIHQTPSVRSYLLAWQGRPMAERAVARALTGLAPITGTLPISIPGVAPVGGGLKAGAAR